MITLKGSSAIYEGTTNDSKPTTGIDVNTLFHELDSNKWYYFTTSSTWVEVPNTGGGGGGGGDITSENVIAMTGYEIAEEAEAIETTDTLNEAVGKLEKCVSINETNILNIQTLTQGIDSTGDNFIEINGVKLYFGSTTPSNPSDGDWWLN